MPRTRSRLTYSTFYISHKLVCVVSYYNKRCWWSRNLKHGYFAVGFCSWPTWLEPPCKPWCPQWYHATAKPCSYLTQAFWEPPRQQLLSWVFLQCLVILSVTLKRGGSRSVFFLTATTSKPNRYIFLKMASFAYFLSKLKIRALTLMP